MAKIKRNIPTMPSNLSQYYGDRIDFIEKSLSFFPKHLNNSWCKMCSSQNFSDSFLKVASPVLSKPVNLYLARKGKMLRALLSCIVLEAAGKKLKNYKALVAMMEIMESDTIMIDDIIDSSPERRGGPSAHIVYGTGNTMLAGGFFYYSSWHIICENFLPISEKQKLEALKWFIKRHFVTTIGQTEEIYYRQKMKMLSRDRYFQEISSRISILSFGGPLYLAGLAAGLCKKDLMLLDELGDFMGLAYHLRGDELNLFPCSKKWGKLAGDDIIAGTMTYILHETVQELNSKDKSFLMKCLGDEKNSERNIKKCIALIKKTGALEKNREATAYLVKKSKVLIGKLSLSAQYKVLLSEVLTYMAYDRTK
jgi:geranylgeranyl diphosphate synthase, type I